MLGIVIGVPPPRGKESTSPSSYSLSATSPVELLHVRPSSSPRRQPYERNKWPSTSHRSHPHHAAPQAHHRRKPPPPPPPKPRYAVHKPISPANHTLTPQKPPQQSSRKNHKSPTASAPKSGPSIAASRSSTASSWAAPSPYSSPQAPS